MALGINTTNTKKTDFELLEREIDPLIDIQQRCTEALSRAQTKRAQRLERMRTNE